MTLFVFCTGSGRVTFNNQRSYLKAVCAAFVEIKTPKFTKKVKTCLLHVVSTAADKSFNSFMLLLVNFQNLSAINCASFPLQVQIDPYLEDSMCQVCLRQPGPFFCRDQVSGISYSLFFLFFGEHAWVKLPVQ